MLTCDLNNGFLWICDTRRTASLLYWNVNPFLLYFSWYWLLLPRKNIKEFINFLLSAKVVHSSNMTNRLLYVSQENVNKISCRDNWRKQNGTFSESDDIKARILSSSLRFQIKKCWSMSRIGLTSSFVAHWSDVISIVVTLKRISWSAQRCTH